VTPARSPAVVEGAAAATAGLLRSRVVRFALVGASGVAVNLGALWFLAGALGLREVFASAIAVEASIVWNFALNDAFTFRDRNAAAQVGAARRWLRYNLISLVGLAIQLGTFVLLRAAVLNGLHREALGALRYPVQCAGIALATAWSFSGNLHFTWRQARAPGDRLRGAAIGQETA
jgi:putative flippase GtrA